MPELPEVENIRLQLERFLCPPRGKHTLTKIEIHSPKLLEGEIKNVQGTEVAGVRRFGKLLAIDFKNGYSIACHVKMTGQLVYRGPNLSKPPKLSPKVGDIPGKHTHVVFSFDRDGKLYFNDYRRFGWLKIMPTKEIAKLPFVAKLGPEPLKNLDRGKFAEILRKSRKPIKNLLMDQSKIAGVGNIYANDALWLSRLDPRKPASKLVGIETNKLFAALEQVLKLGLEKGGASENSFVRPDGSGGSYQKYTLVYGRAGQLCKNCGSKIEKFTLAGRGTFWCPKCQN